MPDIVQVLSDIEAGDPAAADQLLPLVYDELRQLAAARLAQEQPGQTLQATALVHEAYLRMVKSTGGQDWDSRGHFFAAAARAMRQILVNRARDKRRLKRGGGRRRVDLSGLTIAIDAPPEELIDLDEAIDELRRLDAVSAEIVELRFFAGLSLTEAAEVRGLTRRQADRHWAYARAWLYDRLRDE